MSLEGFICPDGGKVRLQDCLSGCVLSERCLTLPTLVAISREKEWNGVPSTTQLLNGTMQEFLKLTKPYYVDPDKRAFMLEGIKHHQLLEYWAKQLCLPAEIPLSVDRDIFDVLEWEGDKLVMTDYKRWGSFRVARALGLVEIGKQPDPSGAVYKTNSKYGKAGEPKMITVWGRDPKLADTWEQNYQLNRYRVMLGTMGITVHRLQLQVSVRDGGLHTAKERGVFRNIYRIPIPILPDEEILAYFKFKEDCLMEALEKNEWDVPCSSRESWEGERCKHYCDVWEWCSKGQLVHSIGDKE